MDAVLIPPETTDRVELVAEALRSHNIEAIIVETGDQAREVVLGLIPDGAEVHSGKSQTLHDVGLYAELFESGHSWQAGRTTVVLVRERVGV